MYTYKIVNEETENQISRQISLSKEFKCQGRVSPFVANGGGGGGGGGGGSLMLTIESRVQDQPGVVKIHCL